MKKVSCELLHKELDGSLYESIYTWDIYVANNAKSEQIIEAMYEAVKNGNYSIDERTIYVSDIIRIDGDYYICEQCGYRKVDWDDDIK